MGFPENVLTSGEKVEKSLHPHWRTVVGPMVIGLILIAACVYAAYLSPDDTKGNVIQWIAVGVGVLIGIPLVIVPFLRWRTTHYVITTHRVMVRKGIVNKNGKDITLSKITDVSFSQTLLDRMLGSGTLSIESAGDSPNEAFEAIPRSDRVQQLLNHLIDQGRQPAGPAHRQPRRLRDRPGGRRPRARRGAADARRGGATGSGPAQRPLLREESAETTAVRVEPPTTTTPTPEAPARSETER
jgi:uncharacterized membrane protein YdbT with pleckstrin-like domain